MGRKVGSVIIVIIMVFTLGTAVGGAQPNVNPQMVYNNHYDGYSITYPSHWQLDETQKESVVEFKVEGQMHLRIYHQPLQGISPHEYIWYTNKQILGGYNGIQLIQSGPGRVRNYSTQEFVWVRPLIEGVDVDLNYYRQVNIIGRGRVYTFWMKATEQEFNNWSGQLDQLLNSFTVIPRTESIIREVKDDKVDDIVLTGTNLSFEIPKDSMVWGAFLPWALVTEEGTDKMNQLEEDLDHRFDFLMTYYYFRTPFPREMMERAYREENRIVMLTWQPWWTGEGDYHATPDIVGGVYDDYIREWAREIKDLGEPVFLRISNEMNGDWTPWCVWFMSLDHDLYKQAWIRIHDIFREEGVDNVQFVWNPHDRSYPDFRWNDPHLYYPGDEYVDWIGLTGYNNGTSFPYDVWRGFDEIHRPLYDDYNSRYPDKPFIIGEFSCNEEGGDKAAWIEEGFASLPINYPKIRIAVWFNQIDMKWLYEIDSTPESKEAFRQGLTNPYYMQGAVKDISGEKMENRQGNEVVF